MTEEKIFYEDQDMKVTSARVIAKNQTFAMAGITSVEVKREDHKVSMLPALVTMMLGLGAMPTSWVMGSVIVVVSIYLFVKESSAPPIFHLVLRTAGSEVNAYTSDNATYIETISQAINDAIVYRG